MTERDGDAKRTDADADMRAAFTAVRNADAVGAPPFEAVLALARRDTHRRRPWLVPALTGSVAAAALAVAIVAVMHRPEPRVPPPVSIEEWTAPTDFLLETPGRELLETVPRIGEIPWMARLEGLDDREKRRRVSP